jgi:NADH-quinone oxidoreductase subunit E
MALDFPVEGDRAPRPEAAAMSAVPRTAAPAEVLTEDLRRRIDRELAKYPADKKQSAVMAALAIAQQRVGWVSPEVIDAVARYLELPPIAIHEVASFYAMYATEPVGRFKIGICTCLPCALRDGAKAGEYLKQQLGIDYGETTDDGQFTLLETECLGSCGDAPVCLVNNQRMESFLDNARIDALIADLRARK